MPCQNYPMRTLGSTTITRDDGSTYIDIDGTVVTGGVALRQRLEARLRLLRGTWRLDIRAGLFDLATLPGSDAEGLGMLARMVREDILQLEEVTAVRSIDARYTGLTRVLRIDVEVDTIYGPMATGVAIG